MSRDFSTRKDGKLWYYKFVWRWSIQIVGRNFFRLYEKEDPFSWTLPFLIQNETVKNHGTCIFRESYTNDLIHRRPTVVTRVNNSFGPFRGESPGTTLWSNSTTYLNLPNLTLNKILVDVNFAVRRKRIVDLITPKSRKKWDKETFFFMIPRNERIEKGNLSLV